MIKQPIPLSPDDVRTLISCPLHYHFLQQKAALPPALAAQMELDRLVGEAIKALHAAGGPARLSLEECLWPVVLHPAARQMVENYYHRLERDWPRVLAVHETMTLKISIAGISLLLEATVDRLDRTSDGGILAILIRTQEGPLPGPDDLRQDPALTIYHALVAAAYPLRRPVRIQELWLRAATSGLSTRSVGASPTGGTQATQAGSITAATPGSPSLSAGAEQTHAGSTMPGQEVTIELDEEEYRSNLQRLRDPVRALARGEVMARPGLHCDVCPFKYRGCPVYAQDSGAETEPQDFDSSDSPSKMSPRQWIFKN
jgi:hypothetical protein